MKILIDTNILLRSSHPHHEHFLRPRARFTR